MFGFLAFSTYLTDAIYQFVQLRQSGELPEIRLPPVIANNLGKMTGKGNVVELNYVRSLVHFCALSTDYYILKGYRLIVGIY